MKTIDIISLSLAIMTTISFGTMFIIVVFRIIKGRKSPHGDK